MGLAYKQPHIDSGSAMQARWRTAIGTPTSREAERLASGYGCERWAVRMCRGIMQRKSSGVYVSRMLQKDSEGSARDVLGYSHRRGRRRSLGRACLGTHGTIVEAGDESRLRGDVPENNGSMFFRSSSVWLRRMVTVFHSKTRRRVTCFCSTRSCTPQ